MKKNFRFYLFLLAALGAALTASAGWTWIRDTTKGAGNNQLGVITNDVTGVWLYVSKFSPDLTTSKHDQSYLEISSINNPQGLTTVDISEAQCSFQLTSTFLITSTVTRIKSPANTGIKKLILPETVQHIESLSTWTSLEEIEPQFPRDLYSIGQNCFQNTKIHGTLVFRSKTKGSISTQAFYGLTGITNVDMSAANMQTLSVHSIFYGCTGLQEVHFSTNVTYIGRDVFRGCSSLTNITPHVFTNLTTLGNQVFMGTKIEGDLVFSSPGLTSIPQYAFQSATKIASVDLSGSPITSIGLYAFGDCSNLRDVRLPNTLVSIGGYAFSNCKALRTITPFLPPSVKSIDPYAFEYVGCTNDLFISNPAFNLVRNANTSQHTFQRSAIPSVDFTGTTNSLTIGKETFCSCTNLKKVVFGVGAATFGGTNPFEGTPLEEIRFCGATPVNMAGSYFRNNWTGFSTKIYRPKFQAGQDPNGYWAAWDAFLTNADYKVGWTTRDLTDAEKASFRTKWPGEKMAKKAVQVKDYQRVYQYLSTWWPNGKPGLSILIK